MNTTAAPARKSHAPRYLFLFLLGLVVGVIGTVMAMRAIDARKDHFHEALMHVQAWHVGQLKAGLHPGDPGYGVEVRPATGLRGHGRGAGRSRGRLQGLPPGLPQLTGRPRPRNERSLTIRGRLMGHSRHAT